MDQDEAMKHLEALSNIARQEDEMKKSAKSSHFIPNFDISFQSMKGSIAEFFRQWNTASNVDLKESMPITQQPEIQRDPLNLRVVLISDTHADHRSMQIPDGDILIHAGDWTCYGHREHAEDFNEWLGTLPHQYKIVVNGNHENNAMWKRETPSILSNATFLCQQALDITIKGQSIKLFGTDFFWPTAHCGHPFLDQIPIDCDILICHGPPFGLADGGKGCEYLQKKCLSLAYGSSMNEANVGRLRLVVCGHIHYGYGVDNSLSGLTVVNASNCGSGRKAVNAPIVLDI